METNSLAALATAVVTLLTAALLVGYLPAGRASRVDRMTVVRLALSNFRPFSRMTGECAGTLACERPELRDISDNGSAV